MIPQKPQKHFNDERNIEPDRISLVLSFVHCVLKGTDPQGHWPLSTQQRHWPSDLWRDRKSKNLQIIKDTGNRSESEQTLKTAALQWCQGWITQVCAVVWRVRWKPRWKPSSQPVVCVCRLTPPRWRLSFPGCPAPSDRSWPASERAWRNAGTSAASRASRARRPPPLAPEVMASPFKGRKH